MRLKALVAAMFLAACATPGGAPPADQAPSGPVRSLQEILDQSPVSDWRTPDAENLIYMDLPSGRVIIELAPAYAPNHAANIRALARAHFFDAGAITRAQDNYVVQWGRPEESPAPLGNAQARLGGEVARPRDDGGLEFTPLPDPDTYAPEVGFSGGFPVARDAQNTWMTHCYGIVGAGRDMGLDSGNGGELYVVIGQSPRHLDRNITLVGRVLQGIEKLTTLPRGTGPLGFYETPAERTPITSIRVAADVPEAERTRLQVLRTDSATFAAVVESRRWRREEWFVEPVGRLGLCNVAAPVRAAP